MPTAILTCTILKNVPAYKNLLAVKYPAIIMSISQVAETFFILAIPFFPAQVRHQVRYAGKYVGLGTFALACLHMATPPAACG